jgi:hypothetical protein
MPEKIFTLAPSHTTAPQREQWKSLVLDALLDGASMPESRAIAEPNRMARSTTTRPMTLPGSRFR